MQKTFDILDWNFILNTLEVLKIPQQFVSWIKRCITGARFSISINKGLVGFFKGAREVRQGDPLSPYIFVIAINVLSKMLDIAASHEVFNFHPKCKKIKMTHLCFADDLLIFAKGNLELIMGIQNVLRKFYSFSELQLNCEKSEIFYTGISNELMGKIKQETGFKIRSLPVRYLGVPLITRRLGAKDCDTLVDKITARIKSWSSKLLSFAGRLKLIQSILFSLQNFWCRNFLLPKGVLNKITKLCA